MKRTAALIYITITVAIDMIGFGIIGPVFPKLILGLTGGSDATAAALLGVFGTIFAAMQLIFAPVLGVLSDRIGRRPVIILSCFGLAIDYLIMALAPTIGWLYVGRILTGMTAANLVTAYAYVSDVTAPEKRAGAFGLISGAFGLGFIIGPVIGGLLGNGNPRLPFWVAAALSAVNLVYGFFVLAESLEKEDRSTKFDWRRANPFGALKLLRSHHQLWRLSTISFIGYVAHEALPIVFVVYTIHRFHWTPAMNGVALMIVGACSVAVSMTTGAFVTKFGERMTLVLGLLFALLGFVVMGAANNGAVFLLSIPLICLWSIYSPAVQNLMTRRVSRSEQGELQGALGSMRSIAMLIGPGVFTWTFAAFISRWNLPGAPWYLAAAMMVISVAVAVQTVRSAEYAAPVEGVEPAAATS